MPSLDTIAWQFLDRVIQRMARYQRYNRGTWIDCNTNREWDHLLAYAVYCAMRYHNLYA